MTESEVREGLDRTVYRLDVGDRIRVDVYGEPELSINATIDESGSINYPFIGRVRADSRTVAELESEIMERLRGDYLVAPSVRATIESFRPVYITGEVRTPGAYPYSSGLTVEKALALAGGLTDFASRRNIHLLRDMQPGEGRVHAELGTVVAPGDTIIVDESWF